MSKITKTIGLIRNGIRKLDEGTSRCATQSEKLLGLQLKLYEEVGELCGDLSDLNEYADVLQTLYDIAMIHGYSKGQIEQARLHKVEESGNYIIPAKIWAKDPSNLID